MMGTADPNHIYLKYFFGCLGLFLLLAAFFLAPYSAIWLHESGDAAIERAVAAQANGNFAIFGSGISQDFVDYKLQLYAAKRPEIVAIGSSRVMQFRGAWFRKPYLNMGGVAGNLGVLRSTIDAMLSIAAPKAVIIGLDFWWFLPQWEEDPSVYIPPTSGSYNYSMASLLKPWEWLLKGKISFRDFIAPFLGAFGKGFRADRYGIMAQQSNDGFGPDGSWYYTGEITGQRPSLDYQFADTLQCISRGIKAFYHARKNQSKPDPRHINAFAEIWCKLQTWGVQTFVFIPPLAHKVLTLMDKKAYPHLFELRKALADRGIQVLDLSAPSSLGATDCEFVDGFHGGEVTYARVLRHLADTWPRLLSYVNMDKLDAVIRDGAGLALMPDGRLTERPEIDFLGLGCQKNVKGRP